MARDPISLRDCARSPIRTFTWAVAALQVASTTAMIIPKRNSILAPLGFDGSDVHSRSTVPVEIIDQARLGCLWCRQDGSVPDFIAENLDDVAAELEDGWIVV